MIPDLKAMYIFSKYEYRVIPQEAAPANHRPVYFRKEFTVSDRIKKATLCATALGIYEMRIDGEKVGDAYFSPGWTDYAKRVYYQTYDVTSLLKEGKHTLAAVVADGWYSGNIASAGMCMYGSIHCLKAQLCISYENGESETVNTDLSWKAGFGGYMTADFLMGEVYDEAEEPVGWDKSGFDDSAWTDVGTDPRILCGHLLLPQKHEPVKKMLTLTPVLKTVDKKGHYIYDMGQNMAGTVTVSVEGKKKKKLVIRYGEMLCDDGTLYTENLRSAKQTDTYIFAQDGTVDYTPHFTFHGFRYVESNLPLLSIVGNVLHSAAVRTGFVETSDETVNRLYENQLWGHRGNWIDIPMDCPQRDERLGWTGDAQLFAKTACYNMQMEKCYSKYLADIRDAQLPNGEIPNIAPNLCINLDNLFMPRNFMLTFSGFAGWSDAVFIITYALFHIYGNKDVIAENYDTMKQYASFMKITGSRNCKLADWLSVERTPSEIIAHAYYFYDFSILSEMAAAIGMYEDSEKYRQEAEHAREEFYKAYVSPDGKLYGDTQCGYALAIKFGLVKDVETMASHLVRTVERAGNHLQTGFIGTGHLLPALCDIGRSDLAYAILLQETYPSWGYTIQNGATTMWERWNSYSGEKFMDPNMNSFNHQALGAVGEWMYEYMGGIKPQTPGFEQIQIKPYMDRRVNEVSVSYNTPRGEAAVWYNVKRMQMRVLVPADTKATIYLPDGKCVTASSGTYMFAGTENGEWHKENGFKEETK